MSGRENIFLNGTILGMTKAELKRKFDEIIDFAEIGDFIEAPVATYSSGMRVRLGFAIAIHCDPDILLIDEILAVGDLNFQQKCFDKLGKLKNLGTTIVFVSHDMNAVQRICRKAILFDKGIVVKQGNITDVIGHYYNLCANYSNGNLDVNLELKEKNVSTYKITYKYLKITNSENIETRDFKTGDDIFFEWCFQTDKELNNVTFHLGLMLDAYTFNGYSTFNDNIVVEKFTENTIIKLHLKKVFVSQGKYRIGIGIWDAAFIGCYFWDYESPGHINISSEKNMFSRFYFDHEWIIK